MVQNRITLTFNNDEDDLYQKVSQLPNKSEFIKNLARQFFDGGCEGGSANADAEAAVDPELEKIEITKLYESFYSYLKEFSTVGEYTDIMHGRDNAIAVFKANDDALLKKCKTMYKNDYTAMAKYCKVRAMLKEKLPKFAELLEWAE